MKHVAQYENFIAESHYAYLGGNTNLTDAEMREKIVKPLLGDDFDAYVMFEGPAGEYEDMVAQWAPDTKGWERVWRSPSYQSYADVSPDGKVVKAAVFRNGGIVGALYVKR